MVVILQPLLRCLMHFTTFQATWIITADSIARVISSVCLGKFSDSYGRRRVILLPFALHLVMSVLSGLSSSLTMIIITRTAVGLATSSRSAVAVYNFEVLPVSKRKYTPLLKISLARVCVWHGSRNAHFKLPKLEVVFNYS